MKHYPCYLCGADEPVEIDRQEWPDTYLTLLGGTLNDQSRRLVVCNACGFVQRDPKLTPEELDVLYQRFRDHGVTTETPDRYFDRITSLPPGKSENHDKLEWLAPRLARHFGPKGPGSALDIGCGGGVFFHAFAKRFPDCRMVGVEPTPAFAELARRRLGIMVIDAMYGEGLIEERFDAIFAIQVLEHVFDPVAFLGSVRRNLNPGGVAYIEVPDVHDFGYLPPDHDRFMSQHLHVFSRASLTEVCRRAGLKIVDLDAARTLRDKHNLLALVTPDVAAPGAWREPAEHILALRRRLPN
jgi:SAM-dependent methyltransferase